MNELIKVQVNRIGGDVINSVNARNLWKYLGSKREFSTWIKGRIDKYGFVEGEDYITIDKKVNRQTLVEYIISIDMAKELAMVENNTKGREIRKYFIEIERQYLSDIAGWEKQRIHNKFGRGDLTLTIKKFTELAKEQGCSKPDYYFMNFTKLVQKGLFTVTSLKKIKKNLRDHLNEMQLSYLTTVEHFLNQELNSMIEDEEYYRTIYQIAKVKVNRLIELLGSSFPALLTENDIKLLEGK